MKKLHLVVSVIAIIVAIGFLRLLAAENAAPAADRYEYATIRWAGKDNTHIVRAAGQVEFIGHELRKAQKPDRTDERAFYLNLAMNGLAREGFEFAGMTHDEIVMRRRAGER